MTPMQHRALEQVKEAGRNGLLVPHGWESVTQAELVEMGLIDQEHGPGGSWRFTITSTGKRELALPR
jgi:hypothetical protein